MKSYILSFAFTLLALTAISQEKLQPAGEIPILAWVGVPENETTIERFRELKESGININFSSYKNIEAVERALDIAQQTGVKLLPYCPELKSEPEKTAKRLMKHPALSGYHLRDEPNATDFPELAAWVKRIQSVDKEHPCYINLFPNYASAEQLFAKGTKIPEGKDTYAHHLDVFLKEVPVPFISFDHYPVIEGISGKSLRPGWYKNLEIALAASQKSGLPIWAFALAVAHDPYPVPTVEEIKVQMYSNLAYGAQVLQYFTYWTPGINPSWDFHDGPIGLDGRRTVVYDRVKQVNQELQKVSDVFMGSKVVSINHTGKRIPAGTKRVDRLPDPIKVLETSDGGAVVSVLEKGNRRFLVIVNRDFNAPMTLTIVTDNKVKKVLKDGTLVRTDVYASKTEVDPGDVSIYCWEN